ncbi:MAG: hypothetical protein ACXVEE_01130 [Polyangiales bacterium]
MNQLERVLRDTDECACLVDARVLRRVLRKHRGARGGMHVPHDRCYWVDRASFTSLTSESERGGGELPEQVILVARPDDGSLREIWRSLFHARVHLALEQRKLGAAEVKARVHAIGQATFDEIRAVLRQDDLLLPGADDVETWIEFAATYLELAAFEAEAVDESFPTLDRSIADRTIAQDLDATAILERARPSGAPDIAPRQMPSIAVPPPVEPRVSRTSHPEVLRAARSKGNVVRAILDGEESSVDEDILSLARRVSASSGDERAEDLARALGPVARAARSANIPAFSNEARLLFDLQHACIEHERVAKTVDVLGAVFSLFRKKAVRPIPASQPVRVVRQLRRALEKIPGTRLPRDQRELVREAVTRAVDHADERLRATLRPAIVQALDEVGLSPRSVPEKVAREKVVDELLDQISARGHLSVGELRDALSRNRLKVEDLDARRFFAGDELLRADRALSVALDGVYRRGEIYLRGLQKVSSLAFGTNVGRLVVMWLILPLIASFVVLEGVSHLVHPIAKRMHKHVQLLNPYSFVGLAVVILALLHSATARKIGLGVARVVGGTLHFVFFGFWAWLFTLPLVVAIATSAPMRAFGRWVLKPALVAAPAYLVARRFQLSPHVSVLIALAALPVVSMFLNSRAWAAIEEVLYDSLSRAFRNLKKRILPGILGFLLQVVRSFVEGVERTIYWVDERLLFREGDSKLSMMMKGSFGALWGIVTFVVRFYVNLLIEPQVNPIKHFPVVTVSHKIILPMLPTLLAALRTPLMPLGSVFANTVAGATCFLLPGVFGFLAWELKENRRLYRAALPSSLEPVRLGGHGETMTGLLVPGFHSGTVPKLWTRLRRTARRIARREPFWKLAVRSYTRSMTDVHHVEEAIARFVEREMIALLARTPRWTGPSLEVGHVRIGSNRVSVELVPEHGKTCSIAFEEQSGFILANVADPGFVAALDGAGRAVFADALGGLYALAGVDFVREELDAALAGAPYDVCDDGLAVWPDRDFRAELLYDLDAEGVVTPVARGDAKPTPLDVGKLHFGAIAWSRWSEAWTKAEAAPVVERALLR